MNDHRSALTSLILNESNDEDLLPETTKSKKDQKSLLFNAVVSGDLESCEKIIKSYKKLSLNAQNAEGMTALWVAALSGNKEIVELLLKNEASMYVLSPTGESLMVRMFIAGQVDIAKILIEHGYSVDEKNKDMAGLERSFISNIDSSYSNYFSSVTDKSHECIGMTIEND